MAKGKEKRTEEKNGVEPEMPSREELEAAAEDLVLTMDLKETNLNEDLSKLDDEELATEIKAAADLLVGTENLVQKQREDDSIENPDFVSQSTKNVLKALGCDPGVCVRLVKEEPPPVEKPAKKEKTKKTEAERGEARDVNTKKMDRTKLLASAKEGNFRVPPPFLKDDKASVEKLRAYVKDQWKKGPIIKAASGERKQRIPKEKNSRLGAFVTTVQTLCTEGYCTVEDFQKNVKDILSKGGKSKIGKLEYECKFALEFLAELGFMKKAEDGTFKIS